MYDPPRRWNLFSLSAFCGVGGAKWGEGWGEVPRLQTNSFELCCGSALRPENLLMNSKISIVDLEVFYHVGVPDSERAAAQRLLLTVEMEFDFSAAAHNDEIANTINYFAVSQRLLKFGEGHSWKLIEKLASDIADAILTEFQPAAVNIEVKKFIIPEAHHVSVALTKRRG
jgi:dihydroneopterin aldolase